MKKRPFRILLIAALAGLAVASCGVFNQLAGLANLANCKYALNNVTDVYVAGVSVKQVSNGNITAADVLKLTTALAQKKVPLTMSVNVDVTNPTEQAASLTAMDWVCELDGLQLATGTSTKAYNITPNATTRVALPISTDVYTLFSSKGLDALKSFVSGFKSNGTNDKLAIAIRPMVKVGELSIPSPSYINIMGKCRNLPAIDKPSTNTGNPTNTGSTKPQGTQHSAGTPATPPAGKK